jgi:transposase
MGRVEEGVYNSRGEFQVSAMVGSDRKTVRKYLAEPEARPQYGPRASQPGKLDRYEAYLQERLAAGVWNAAVLLRELRGQGYTGGYTILKDWLQPQRESARVVAVRRFETPAGKQAQVDWAISERSRPAANNTNCGHSR